MFLDDNLKNQQQVSLGRTEEFNGITVSLGSHMPPIFEFLAKPSNLHLNQLEHFGCQVLQSDWIKSNLINVTILAKVPKLTFSTNVSQIETQKPFTVTCRIDNFDSNQNYFVKFFNSLDGLLATFEVENNNEPLITSERHRNMTVNFGKNFKYPNFDIVIVENNNIFQSYWCNLELRNVSNNISFNSNHWPAPQIKFNSTKTGQVTTGRCSVSSLETFNNSYKIKYFTDFGPAANNLLATYTITPGKPELFITEPSNLYTNITHGNHRLFPVFEINVKFATNSNNWWCTLTIGDKNQSNYEEIKSNKIKI